MPDHRAGLEGRGDPLRGVGVVVLDVIARIAITPSVTPLVAQVESVAVLVGDLLEELAADGRLTHPTDGTDAGAGDEQMTLGPGHADEAEPSLLLEFEVALAGAAVRKKPVLDPDHRDGLVLEALRGVQSHQGDDAGVRVDHVGVADERHRLEVLPKGDGHRDHAAALVIGDRRRNEVGRRRDQFGQVRLTLPLLLALVRRLGTLEAALSQNAGDEIPETGRVAGGDLPTPVGDDRRESQDRLATAGRDLAEKFRFTACLGE